MRTLLRFYLNELHFALMNLDFVVVEYLLNKFDNIRQFADKNESLTIITLNRYHCLFNLDNLDHAAADRQCCHHPRFVCIL